MEVENWSEVYTTMRKEQRIQRRQVLIWRTAFIVETVAVVLIGLTVLVR